MSPSTGRANVKKLDLAVDIAKTVAKADKKGDKINIEAKAKQLSKAHPESNASRDEIAEVLHDEGQAAGVEARSPDDRATSAMNAGLYQLMYQGSFDRGGAVLYVGNGIIAGMDVGEIQYDGTYTTGPGGELVGDVALTATTNSSLVTGDTVLAGQSVSVPFTLPSSFANGQPFQFKIAGRSVSATFRKFKDLP
jgi:hypothetical protein